MNDGYQSRKFLLAAGALISIIVALFTKTITGGEFNLGLAAILGLYGAANVKEKQNAGTN